MRRIFVDELMTTSGVGFGTSGARGLADDMTDELCFAYAVAFFQYLVASGWESAGSAISLGGDRRSSTPRILRALAAAAHYLQVSVDYQGLLPSPALVLHGIQQGRPTIMVTGSHIPADRNGLKFTTPFGEINKRDEQGIREQVVELPEWFDEKGNLVAGSVEFSAGQEALQAYEKRFLSAFAPRCLRDLRIGVYGHSAVGREFLIKLYRRLGAAVVALGWSDEFVSVDTEAIRAEDVASAKQWAKRHDLDAIASTDGDSDRPLLADEKGEWLRGDIAGILAAQYLAADGVATAISCNTGLETSGFFSRTLRTKIGSPFVIEGMTQLAEQGARRVVGYEANGGFLQHSLITLPGGRQLSPLPTRDATIVHLALLMSARRSGKRLSDLRETLPQRATASGRDQAFETSRSHALLERLRCAPPGELETVLGLGPIASVNNVDGLRVTFESGDIVHWRPSGNAPELRCYAEARNTEEAERLVSYGLEVAKREAYAAVLS